MTAHFKYYSQLEAHGSKLFSNFFQQCPESHMLVPERLHELRAKRVLVLLEVFGNQEDIFRKELNTVRNRAFVFVMKYLVHL